jgi:mycothiol system anti-sigma-R factor
MTCEKARQLLHAYLDDELDLATAFELESHLDGCPNCGNELDAARAVGQAVAESALYHRAPAELRDRLQQAIRAEGGAITASEKKASSQPWWKRPMAFSGIAAAMLVLIGSSVLLLLPRGSHREIDELVDSHLRSLEANHLLDVESTDQHTVKPWFAGKLDFSPPVVDLSAEGFPLIGGRLDDLNQRSVAALIYRRNKHIINLFIWPVDSSLTDAASSPDTKNGFNLIKFDCKGMTCWAVSDLNGGELGQFVDLFKSQKPASTRS